jgi:chaperone modulatory protein CbpM
MGKKSVLNIKEIIQSYELSETFIVECIRCEWIIPCDCEKNLLDEVDIARLMLIRDLKSDFGVNDESIPIILHLVDQIHALQARVKHKFEYDRGGRLSRSAKKLLNRIRGGGR